MTRDQSSSAAEASRASMAATRPAYGSAQAAVGAAGLRRALAPDRSWGRNEWAGTAGSSIIASR